MPAKDRHNTLLVAEWIDKRRKVGVTKAKAWSRQCIQNSLSVEARFSSGTVNVTVGFLRLHGYSIVIGSCILDGTVVMISCRDLRAPKYA
jgi:hypothetical protein